ncbi:hypothetical protein P9X10_00795 [Bacillus cereus]|nr:hypothetical protein [Bacillus cereus]
MESKYFIADKVPKGTRIRLREPINNIPTTMVIYFKRVKVAGITVYPLFSSLIQLGVGEKEFIDHQLNVYGEIHTLETVDFTNHSIPYPVRGVIQVDFSKGLVMEFREEKQEKLFMKRLDKAYKQLIVFNETE